ncbi:coiled-coil domain-containing protein 40 [Orussus abietinus]|uniref:coiled-coil domain-containing protein 40 n=1 Tax=Orussus abietinus TaxID=222816 RepID=UPI00062549C4|nr:coiled-coil domain-containing protein 40 [Orussus abietinus]
MDVRMNSYVHGCKNVFLRPCNHQPTAHLRRKLFPCHIMCDEATKNVPPPLVDESPCCQPGFPPTSSPASNVEPMEDTYPNPKKQVWVQTPSEELLQVLDPDDPLMKRFQDALQKHLLRIDKKLSEEILELEASIKVTEKRREDEGIRLYDAQLEIDRQQETIESYQKALSEIIRMREEVEEEVKRTKEEFKKVSDELQSEKSHERSLARQLETMSSLQRQFNEWEQELASSLIVSQRISEKEAVLRKEQLRQKQNKDYILFKLTEEVLKREDEIINLKEQLQLKEKEKADMNQVITDANADLEGVQRERKTLFDVWNNVITCIRQRDKVFDEIGGERLKIRESFRTLQTQIEKVKKDTTKEMENNENLTGVQMRIEDDIHTTTRNIDGIKDKIINLESNMAKTAKLIEYAQNDYDGSQVEYQQSLNEEKNIDKTLEKLFNEKVEFEDKILEKLEDKVTHDKAAKYLNKLLQEARDSIRQQELSLVQAENTYGKSLLEIERLNSTVDSMKCDVNELTKCNIEKEKEIDNTQTEIKRCDLTIGTKQRTLISLNKKIEQILSTSGGEEISPIDLKILSLEKNIEELDAKNMKSQQFWLRQEGYMVTLSQERSEQLAELNLLSKQITIMEQKNLKLEFELEKQRKEEANIIRTVNLCQQKLVQLNSQLAVQRELKGELEGKNCVTKTEYVKALQEAELQLIQLQNDIKQLEEEKNLLKQQLNAAQRESLSWEKKVQLAQETSKTLKEERGNGGDVATMKSEIHKMEMRLTHLRKVQEKLIQDMEFCVMRRDVIVDEAMAKEKKNPKGVHNRRIVIRKRLEDQKKRLKQILKEGKQTNEKLSEVETQQKELLMKLDEGQSGLRAVEDTIPDIDNQIQEAEITKHHNLQMLVRKQRKVKMLQDVKDGRYRMLFKSEGALNEELEKQRIMNADLTEIMEQTQKDFPLLKNSIRPILLTLQTPCAILS